jgi:uncharacterized protein (DUF3084 family)
MSNYLKKEIENAEREFEAIEQETDKCSRELEILSKEVKDVQEAATFTSEEARLVDEGSSGLTGQSRSPRRHTGKDVDHTRTLHAQSMQTNNPDSDIEIISPPFSTVTLPSSR